MDFLGAKIGPFGFQNQTAMDRRRLENAEKLMRLQQGIAEEERQAQIPRDVAAGTQQAMNAIKGVGGFQQGTGQGSIGDVGLSSLAQNIYQQMQSGNVSAGQAAQSALMASQPAQDMQAALLEAQTAQDPFGGLKITDALDIQAEVTGLSQGIQSAEILTSMQDAYPNALSLAADGEAQGTARTNMIQLAASMNSILDLGALTKDEREFLFDMLDNPDSVIGRLWGRDTRAKAVYRSLISKMETRRLAMSSVIDAYGATGAIDFGSLANPFAVPNFPTVGGDEMGSPTRQFLQESQEGGGVVIPPNMPVF